MVWIRFSGWLGRIDGYFVYGIGWIFLCLFSIFGDLAIYNGVMCRCLYTYC